MRQDRPDPAATVRRLVQFLNTKGIVASAGDEAHLHAVLAGFDSVADQQAFEQRARQFKVHELLLEDVTGFGGAFDPPTRSLAAAPLFRGDNEQQAIAIAQDFISRNCRPAIVVDGNDTVVFVGDETAGVEYSAWMCLTPKPVPTCLDEDKFDAFQLLEPGCPTLRQVAGHVNQVAARYRGERSFTGCVVLAAREDAQRTVVYAVTL